MAGLKIAFCINHLGAVEPQSFPLVMALARNQGHQVDLAEFGPNPKKARRKLAERAPDIVAYSVCSNEIQEYLAFNRSLKQERSFFSLFGGPHPTFSPSMIHEQGVDAICRGEGDATFPLFLETFGSQAMYEVPNFCFKTPDGSVRENPLTDLIPDLDTLPFPARDIVYAKSYFMANNPIKSFMAGRGCPNNCSYCFNHSYNRMYRGKGQVIRVKSVSRLIAEIADVARSYPLRFVRFHDDVFGSNSEWLAEFAQRFPKEIAMPFSCYIRANMVTEEYAALLKKAGCYSVCTAIECANERLRNDVLCRYLSDEQITTACERIKKRGIRIFSFNMLGVPGETEQDIFATIDMNRRLEIDFADASIFQPYPGTRAFEYCKEHSYLSEDTDRFENVYSSSILDLPPDFKQRIYILHKLFTFLVDHPGAIPFTRFIPNTKYLDVILNFFCRLYYGYFLHRRIYKSVIPLRLRARGAFAVLLSKSRI